MAVAAKTHWPRTRFEGLSLHAVTYVRVYPIQIYSFLWGNTMGFNRFVLLHAGRKLLHRPPRSTSVVRLCNAHDRISRYHVTHRCLCILSKLFLFFSEFSSDRHVSYNDHGRLLCLRKSMAQIVISIELHERATWARIVLCLRVEERADSLR